MSGTYSSSLLSPAAESTVESTDMLSPPHEVLGDGDDGRIDGGPSVSAERHSLEYLLRYETMVRTQDGELRASASHLRPLFDRIRSLPPSASATAAASSGEGSVTEAGDETDAADAAVGWGGISSIFRKKPPSAADAAAAESSATAASAANEDASAQHERSAPGGLLTYRAASRAVELLSSPSYDPSSLLRGEEDVERQILLRTDLELMRTDLQLVYVLKALASCDDGSNERRRRGGDDDGVTDDDGVDSEGGLTFPEFLHCYRTAVGGMQCLQQLAADRDDGNVLPRELRRRRRRIAVDRTASLVRTFGPTSPGPASLERSEPTGAVSASAGVAGSAASSLAADPDLDASVTSRISTDAPSASSSLAAAAAVNCPTKAEMRRLLAVKDRQLVRILSDHARNVESVLGEEADKKVLEAVRKLRRKERRRKMFVSGLLIVLATICAVEMAHFDVLPAVRNLLDGNGFTGKKGLGYRCRTDDARATKGQDGQDDIEALRKSATQSKARTFALEAQVQSLETELRGARRDLKVSADALANAKAEALRKAEEARAAAAAASKRSKCTEGSNSATMATAELDSCRAEGRRVREEMERLRSQRRNDMMERKKKLGRRLGGLVPFLGPFRE